MSERRFQSNPVRDAASIAIGDKMTDKSTTMLNVATSSGAHRLRCLGTIATTEVSDCTRQHGTTRTWGAQFDNTVLSKVNRLSYFHSGYSRPPC
jgi:hypothetical protein